ncbi:WbuC family cupin fold metalloprotein [Rapidithrix thailandica]|uniref:WbuC family cupin fold metalloprotein n=1 Tax=Rapidithrix thailandica TaxID=413964 RepID=A0AAW9S4P2_9BACT
MIKIDQTLLDEVCRQAEGSARKRKNYNFHTEAEDTLQRMLNALQPDTYITPHKHANPPKREAFLVLQGKLLIVEFTEEGQIADHTVLSQAEGGFGVEIPEGTYHSLIVLEPDTVIYEVKDGPYDPNSDKGFAPWAPTEEDPDALAFNARILKELGFTV